MTLNHYMSNEQKPGCLGYIGDYDYTWKVKLRVFCGSRANWLEITISIHLNMVGNLLVSRNFSQLRSFQFILATDFF